LANTERSENVTPYKICTCVRCGPPWREFGFEPDKENEFAAWLSWHSWMALCPECGNKRCPGATNHEFPCTHSNDTEVNKAAWKEIYPDVGPTTIDGIQCIVWYDGDGNRHVNGMGAVISDDRKD
jgi:hypothetical protein